jgi:hypothetical protein
MSKDEEAEKMARLFLEELQGAVPLIKWRVGRDDSWDLDPNPNPFLARGTLHIEGEKLIIFVPVLGFSLAKVIDELGKAIVCWRPEGEDLKSGLRRIAGLGDQPVRDGP